MLLPPRGWGSVSRSWSGLKRDDSSKQGGTSHIPKSQTFSALRLPTSGRAVGSIKDSYRWAGIYTGRILKRKASRPAGITVHHGRITCQFENRKSARHFRLSLLARADEVVE